MLWLHERDTIDCRHIDAFTQTPRVGYDAALAVIHIIEPFQHFLSLINRHLTRYRIAPDVSRTSTILTLPFSYERDVLTERLCLFDSAMERDNPAGAASLRRPVDCDVRSEFSTVDL